jgi:hypothetical protein
MPAFIAILVFFLALAYYAPSAFIAFAEFVDGSRCAIGMTNYCDQDYENIRKFGQ